ncbi:MAG: radical SAM protein [Exiguobacterium sp.]|nr:radical SAM protein [Exiguobacterium sp.]
MRIGLIDVDGHSGFPNLALMKLSAWHKAQGDDVEWYEPLMPEYDKVYMSKVFTFTEDYQWAINARQIVKGGTGYGLYEDLTEEIEYTFPDYSIYPKYKAAIGFLTRGCVRKCPWCIVPKKEGWIHAVNTLDKIKRPDSRDIVFLDNNVLASEHGIAQIEDMIGKDVRIDFNQAMDARLVTPEIAKILSMVKWIGGTLRFACDTSSMIPVVERAVRLLGENGVKPYRIFVYTLIQDVDESLKRIEAMDALGVNPFGQPYRDFNGGEPTEEQKRLARWCNMKAVHKTTSYENYLRNQGGQDETDL